MAYSKEAEIEHKRHAPRTLLCTTRKTYTFHETATRSAICIIYKRLSYKVMCMTFLHPSAVLAETGMVRAKNGRS